MFKVYQPSIYGLFFKDLRKKNKDTIADLSKKTHYSSSTLSNLENTKLIPNEDKLNFLLSFYNLPTNYFQSFKSTIDCLIDQFIVGVIYINDTLVEKIFTKLTQAILPYQNTSLSLIYKMCKVIYTQYSNQSVNEQDIHFLIEHSFYFSKELQYILNVFISYYYMNQKNYSLCEHYLYQATQFNLNQHKYNQMTNYFLSLLYAQKNDFISSVKYLNYAQKDYIEHQNYKRLVHLNSIASLQYMIIGEYSKALEMNKNNLITINEMNMTLERASTLYTIAFIYIIKKDYSTALHYLFQISENLLNEKNYCAIILCLIEKNEYEKAIQFINKGLAINTNPIYVTLLHIYLNYCNNLDHKKFTRDLSNYYTQNKHLFHSLTKEYFLNNLITQYLKLGFITNLNDYLYELYILRLH